MKDKIYRLTCAVIHDKLKGKDKDAAIDLVISHHKRKSGLTDRQKDYVNGLLRKAERAS